MRSFNACCHNRDFLTPPAQRLRPAHAYSVFVWTLIVAGSIEERIVALQKSGRSGRRHPRQRRGGAGEIRSDGSNGVVLTAGGTTAGLPSAAPLQMTAVTASGVGYVGFAIAALQPVAQLGP